MKLIKEDGERSLKGDFQKKLEDLFDGLWLSFFDPEPQDRHDRRKMIFQEIISFPDGFL